MAEYNEDAYKLARKAYIEHSCPFERALLSCCVSCGRSRKLNLAEREAIACGDAAMREHCLVYQALHENAHALKINPDTVAVRQKIRADAAACAIGRSNGPSEDVATDIAATKRHALAAVPNSI
jgi:hypothetical protein